MIGDKCLKKANKWTVSILRAVFLIAFSYILIYPVFFMISNSIKTQTDVITPSVKWLSRSPTLYGFKYAFEAMRYPKSLFNTLFFEISSASIEVLTCAVYAYGMARFEMRFKKVMMFFLVLIILVPDIILVIPRLINFRYMDFLGILGMINKFTGVDLRPNLTDTAFVFWLPSLFGVGLKAGFFMFIYIQFFKGLPVELEEAAWIDGAGPITTFIKIIIPSSGVVILTVFIFSFVWHWNDWLLATMYTNNNRTLATMIYDINQVIIQWRNASGNAIDSELGYGIPLAAGLMFLAPPTVLYLFLQRKFIQSIDRIGIVG